MSYARLHHENESAPAADGSLEPHSSAVPMGSDVASDSDLDATGADGEPETYELKDLSASSHGKSRGLEAALEPEFDDSDNDEDHSPKARRESASTTQSFMLYTPDEERAVVKKFDRRLVLFVAFLYMLSFLDRSSMSP